MSECKKTCETCKNDISGQMRAHPCRKAGGGPKCYMYGHPLWEPKQPPCCCEKCTHTFEAKFEPFDMITRINSIKHAKHMLACSHVSTTDAQTMDLTAQLKAHGIE